MYRLVLLLVLLASCAEPRPREWSDNDWARLSQAVGEELKETP
ncbi:hypothetical protein EVC17_018 [Rhizobium phage RHph_Y1_1]|nr:hypothetical protein EVB80_018 [Rhizobium phage RHph_I36]QIG75375.1 hypothetical protein EVC17_018 [Rhizobium phage RHph_Y1_1]QIG75925.1 hypothetical protein EVC21_018 [Rhizobium phage RHph_Y2_17_2]